MTRRILPVALFSLLALGAALPARAHDFDPGYYTATGTVKPIGFSIYMQGSHLLASSSGATITLLESSDYDLSMYEGVKVSVAGWVEHTVEGHALIMDVWSLTVLDPKIPVPFTIVESGNDSRYDATLASHRTFVIRDAATYELFRAIHEPGVSGPAIDFSKHQIVAAFTGPKYTTADSITITKIEKIAAKLYVTTKTTAPPPGSMMPVLKDPVNPFVLAKTLKTTGTVYFNGKKGKVLTAADLKADPRSLVILGHVVAASGLDKTKIKAGVFAVNIAAKYFQWPGNHPYDVAPVGPSGFFSKEIKPVTDEPMDVMRYQVIVWEDLNGDDSPAGEVQVVSDPYVWAGGSSWTDPEGHAAPKLPHVSFLLAKP